MYFMASEINKINSQVNCPLHELDYNVYIHKDDNKISSRNSQCL